MKFIKILNICVTHHDCSFPRCVTMARPGMARGLCIPPGCVILSWHEICVSPYGALCPSMGQDATAECPIVRGTRFEYPPAEAAGAWHAACMYPGGGRHGHQPARGPAAPASQPSGASPPPRGASHNTHEEPP